MKRLDLVQLTIIIVGIFSAFFFIISLPQFLFFIYSWATEGLKGGFYLESVFGNTIVTLSYLFAAIYCINRSKHFAQWICNKANLTAEINFRLDKSELLFVVFVGLGIYGLIENVPKLLVDGFNRVRSSNSFEEIERVNVASNSSIVLKLITIFFFFVLVYYAKVFADFFTARIDNTEPEDAIAEKTE